jgi:hypothetical protein
VRVLLDLIRAEFLAGGRQLLKLGRLTSLLEFRLQRWQYPRMRLFHAKHPGYNAAMCRNYYASHKTERAEYNRVYSAKRRAATAEAA